MEKASYYVVAVIDALVYQYDLIPGLLLIVPVPCAGGRISVATGIGSAVASSLVRLQSPFQLILYIAW